MERGSVTPSDRQVYAEHRTIVVGVDGSIGAEAALRYAIDDARRRGASLRIAGAWSAPTTAYVPGVPLPAAFFDECERAARTSIERSLLTVGSPADVPIEIVVRQGQPAAVLVAESRRADALVVGSRGLGGFRELLLGSVSHACVRHAHCPVIVVPHEVRSTSDQGAARPAEVTA